MYIGLLNFANLFVFGIAGLAATFLGGPDRKFQIAPVRYESFTPVAGSTDKQIADQIFERLQLPLTEPVPEWALRRDQAGKLAVDFYTVNGNHRVLYIPSENRLRIEEKKNGVWLFLDDVHTVTGIDHADWRMKAWAYYNRFAIWSLLAMTVSGSYLWLASRPRYRVAQYSLACGAGIFILLYALAR